MSVDNDKEGAKQKPRAVGLAGLAGLAGVLFVICSDFAWESWRRVFLVLRCFA